MKSLNRTLSLVLVLVMVLGVFGIAGAAFNDQDKIENTEAVSTMVALNIINGKGNNIFDPAGDVTRAEMAKMICIALNGGKEPVLGTSSTPMFSDIGGHWGQKYIEYCTSLGIIAGMGDGTFAPDAAVTGSQAAKMMLVAMNYKADIFKFVGDGWELNVNVEANKAGLYKDLSVDASAAINRDNAAQLIFNGVFAGTMELGWNQDQTTGNVVQTYRLNTSKTIASEKYNLKTQVAILDDSSYNSAKKEYTCNFSAIEDVSDGGAGVADITTAKDYSQFYGMKVKVLWTVDNKGVKSLLDIYSVDTTVVLAGVVGQLSDATFNANDIVFNGKTYKFDPVSGSPSAVTATPVYDFNSGERSGVTGTLGGYYTIAADPVTAGAAFNPTLASYIFKALDTDGNGKIDKIVVYPYTVKEVTYVGAATATIGGTSYKLEDIQAYEGIAVGDFVKFTASANTTKNINTFEKITPIEGKVEAKTATKTTIAGIAMGDLTSATGLTLGATYENIIVVNGFIYRATLKIDAVSAEKYAVVLAAGTNNYGDDIATILLSDGTKKEVEVSSPAASLEATSSKLGTLVTYTVDASGEYTLSPIVNAGKFSSYYMPAAGLAATDYNYDKGTLGGFMVDDGAVVFAKTSAGYKTLTGKEFKSAHSMNDKSVGTCLFTKYNATTGFSSVILAYVDISASAIGAVEYGYVTSDVVTVKNDKGFDVSKVTFWNGTEDVTLTATKNYKDTDVVTAALAKGDLFRYTVDADGLMTIIDETSGGKVDFFNPSFAQVSARLGNSVQFNEAGSLKQATITDKTVIFNIDSAAKKGVPGTAITKSDGVNDNARFLLVAGSTNNDVAFVVVDTRGVMVGSPNIVLGSSTTAAELTTAFGTYNTVTIAGNFAPADDVTVPAGKTLQVAGNFTPAGDITLNGYLFVSGTRAVAAGKTWTVNYAAGDASAKFFETVTGGAGSKLIFANATDDTAVTSDIGANLKFWATAGSSGTDGTTAVTGGVIAAGTYEWTANAYYGGAGATATDNGVWVKA